MKIGDALGSWILVYPIENLVLTDAVRNEIRVNRVTFIRLSKLKRKTKKFGLPLYSELTKEPSIRDFFASGHDTFSYAIVRQSGKLDDAGEKAEKLISAELDILALSHLYSGNIRPLRGRTVASGMNGLIKFMARDAKSEKRIISTRKTPMREVILDESWHQWQKGFYLDDLILCIREENGFERSWRETILRAVSLVAEGLTSKNSSFTFLHNMIALETVLLRQGDEHKIELPRRLQAFIGWSSEWDSKRYLEKIGVIYNKRCLYVHDGEIETITAEDVDFTDHLLHNVFNNILKHPKLFPSKNKLVEFSAKVTAERLLGISPAHSKYLPRTIGLTTMN